MLLRCVAVVPILHNRYSRDKLYAVAELIAWPDSDGEYEWNIDSFVGPVFDNPTRAIPRAMTEAALAHLPFCGKLEHGDGVDLVRYKADCERAGTTELIPPMAPPASDDLVGKGA